MATSPRHGGWRKKGAIDWTGDVCRMFGEGLGRGRGGLDGEVLSLSGCRSLLSLELQFLKSGRWEETKGIIDCWSGLDLESGADMSL